MKQQELDIRLLSVEEVKDLSHFYHWEILRYSGSPVDIQLSTSFDVDGGSNTVALTIGAHYSALRSQIIRPLLDYAITARFEVRPIDGVMNERDDSVVIATPMLALMLSVALGALRGMLALQSSAGSVLKTHPLPIYDMAALLANIEEAHAQRGA